MSRAEEQALKAYPKRGWKCKDAEGNDKFLDANRECRLAFVKGYEQAISDITMLVIGEKIEQGVDIDKIPQKIDISSVANAVNANCEILSKGKE